LALFPLNVPTKQDNASAEKAIQVIDVIVAYLDMEMLVMDVRNVNVILLVHWGLYVMKLVANVFAKEEYMEKGKEFFF